MTQGARSLLALLLAALALVLPGAARADERIVSWHSDIAVGAVGSSRVDLQACKLEYSIVSPK